MLLWLIKQILNVKAILAGRNRPHQMAWGLALGLLVGIVPHGNLLAVALIMMVVCLNVNHAMVAMIGVAVSFIATRLDPFSHQIGQFVLLHPRLADPLASAWQLPLVPWTDLNNTIVMGSFLIGLAAVLPVYAFSYPLFRLMAPVLQPEQPQPTDPPPASAALRADSDSKQLGRDDEPTTVRSETQIDIIRLKDYRPEDPQAGSQLPVPEADNAQINQALNFLLRRLRNSQQEKAA